MIKKCREPVGDVRDRCRWMKRAGLCVFPSLIADRGCLVGRWLAAAENKDVWLLQHGGSKPPPYGFVHFVTVNVSS